MFPRHEDDSTCSACGAEMEVIGPPGPQHEDYCPYASHKAPQASERNLTDDEFERLLEAKLRKWRRR
jgi:hypothetical protein